jgi:hypothetical protein
MGSWDPSSVHRALSREFLTPVADRIWRVQREVSKHVRPDKGDNDWVAGCTAYQRRVTTLQRMMLEEPYKAWLWAGFTDNQFSIRIHGFPIRIYRAPEEHDIPEKYASPSLGELLFLDAIPEVRGYRHHYRIEVVAKALARPVDIFLVELNEFGQITNTVSIPRSRNVDAPIADSGNGGIRPLRRKPPVVPPKPSVQPNEEKKRPDTNDDEKEKPA